MTNNVVGSTFNLLPTPFKKVFAENNSVFFLNVQLF